MIRKCFTVNAMRRPDEIKSYEEHLIKTNIFKGCEIFYPYNVSKEQYDNYVEGIKSYLKYEDFEITCHLPHGKDNNIACEENIENVMNRMYDAIDFASMFKVKGLTLHPGHSENNEERQVCFMRSVNNVKKIANYAKKYNMIIMIENLVGSHELCLTSEEMLEYLSNFKGENVLMTFDCGHCHAAHSENKTPVVEFVRSLNKNIAHIHLSDNHGEKDEHQKLGTGTIDFVSYFKELKNINYSGLYSSEVLFNSYEDLINTSNAIDNFMKEVE